MIKKIIEFIASEIFFRILVIIILGSMSHSIGTLSKRITQLGEIDLGTLELIGKNTELIKMICCY